MGSLIIDLEMRQELGQRGVWKESKEKLQEIDKLKSKLIAQMKKELLLVG